MALPQASWLTPQKKKGGIPGFGQPESSPVQAPSPYIGERGFPDVQEPIEPSTAVYGGAPAPPAPVQQSAPAPTPAAPADWRDAFASPDPRPETYGPAGNDRTVTANPFGWPKPSPSAGPAAPGIPPSYEPGVPGVLSGPGAYEEWAKKNLSKFDKPSNVEDVYGSGASDVLKTSRSSGLGSVSGGAYQSWADQNKDAFKDPSQREGLSRDMAPELRAPSNAQAVYGDVGDELRGPSAVDKRFDEMGGAFDDPGVLERWSSVYGLDPMKESNSEALYRDADPLMDLSHDYDYQKALTEQRRSTSARGGFNSGAAEYGERDLIARTRADKAKERAALASQADRAKLDRYNQGQGFASDAGAAYSDRIKDAFGVASTKDEGDRASASTLSDIGRTADISEAARRGQALDFASAGDKGLSDRVNNAADLVYRSETLGQADDTENRIRATSADAEERARLQDVYGAAAGADSAAQSRLGIQGGIAAKQQTMGEDRLRGGLDATKGMGDIDAGLLERIIGDTKNVDKLDEAGLQAMAERYGISSEQLKDYLDLAGKIGGAAVDIYSGS